ncbi:hypothetical protein FOZ62_021153 [Perkinsus olseni]|nr:hypothetical protein FOZ62_021153 [Perkinsus olseni]
MKDGLDKCFVDKDFADFTRTENKLLWRLPLRMKTNKSFKAGQESIEKSAAQLKTPILILQASNDKISSPDGSKLLYDLCGSKDKCIKVYDDCAEAGLKYSHELLSAEPVEMAKLVYNDITTWISARKIRADLPASAAPAQPQETPQITSAPAAPSPRN